MRFAPVPAPAAIFSRLANLIRGSRPACARAAITWCAAAVIACLLAGRAQAQVTLSGYYENLEELEGSYVLTGDTSTPFLYLVSGSLDLNGHTLTIGSTGSGGFGNDGTIEMGSGSLVLNSGPFGAYSTGYFTGTGSISNESGTALFVFNRLNYTGTLTVNGGSVMLPSIPDGGSSANVALNITSGGSATAFTTTLGSLAGSGNIQIPGSQFTLSVGASNASSTYSGTISGAGALNKVGTGDLTLTGNSTYTGTTTVSGGQLILDAGSLASTTVNQSGGTLVLRNGGSYGGGGGGGGGGGTNFVPNGGGPVTSIGVAFHAGNGVTINHTVNQFSSGSSSLADGGDATIRGFNDFVSVSFHDAGSSSVASEGALFFKFKFDPALSALIQGYSQFGANTHEIVISNLFPADPSLRFSSVSSSIIYAGGAKVGAGFGNPVSYSLDGLSGLLTLSTLAIGGGNWYFNRGNVLGDTVGIMLTLTTADATSFEGYGAVPEPAAAALLLAMAAGGLQWRRRRRSGAR